MKESGIGFKKSLCVFLASVMCYLPHVTMASSCTQSQKDEMYSITRNNDNRFGNTQVKIIKLWANSFRYISVSEREAFERQYINPRNEFLKTYDARSVEAIKKCDPRTLLSLSYDLASSEDTLILHLTKLSEEADKRRQKEEADKRRQKEEIDKEDNRIMQEAMKGADEADEKIRSEENERFNEAVRLETGLTGASAVFDALSEPAEFLGGKVGEAGAGAVVGKDFNRMQEDLSKGRMEALKSLTPEGRADFSKKMTQSTGNPATDIDNQAKIIEEKANSWTNWRKKGD